MPFLVDGYNLYHAACKWRQDWSSMIPLKLCELIGEDMRRLGDFAVVVFDGRRPRGQWLEQSDAETVRVLFSGPEEDADTVLDSLIRQSSAPRRLTVVSSDRQVRRAARRRRAKSLRATDYLQELVQRSEKVRPRPREPREKRTGLEAGQLQEWLDLFELDIDSDTPSNESDRIGF